jgi:hypothetical protein
LFFEIRWRLVLPFTHVNIDEFEGDVLLMEDESYTKIVGGGIGAVEFENHVVGETTALSGHLKSPSDLRVIDMTPRDW